MDEEIFKLLSKQAKKLAKRMKAANKVNEVAVVSKF